ncbi:MAG: PAS domain-containing protein, partial [Patescibacteria group bacterium]|nr:PAS domain-containing protein [Patescibacteria group bacterium]
MKIRAKFVSLFLVLAVLGSASSFVITNYFLRNTIVETVGNYNVLLAEERMNAVDRTIFYRLERWESYAQSNTDLVGALKNSNQEFRQLSDINQYIGEQDKKWLAAPKGVLTPFMRTIIENKLTDGLKARIKFYNDKYEYAIFPEFFVTNEYGAVVAATGKTSDYNQADEEWWQRAKEQGLYVGDITYDESSGYYALELGIRVDDANGNFLGVIKSIYNPRDIFDTFNEADTKLAGVIDDYLLTADGRLIYSRQNGFGGLSNSQEILEPFNLGAQNHSDYYIGDLNGANKFFSYAASDGYRDFKGLGWSVVVVRDSTEALAPLSRLVYYNLIAVIIVMILLLLIGISASSFIVRPIKKLNEDILVIKSGNLDRQVSAESNDEIGDLAHSFSLLVEDVKMSRADIEKKVKEQTEVIGQKAKDLEDQKKAILNILEDIEEEKGNSEKERDKINTIIHGIGDGVFVTDENYRIILFNQVAADLSGFTIAEAVGKRYDEILKFVRETESAPDVKSDEFIVKAISAGQPGKMANHTVLISKTGRRISVADSAAPLKDKTGKIIGCVVVFRDVTKEREVDRVKSE